jgi:three-Cys-motif partner protein
MTTPKSTLWLKDRHTQAKHEILRRYLEAWFPILVSHTGKARIIDGFAGPGEYEDGSIGSPLIALDVLLKHTYKPIRNGNVELIFIEQDLRRCQHLQQLVSQKRLDPSFPPTLSCNIIPGIFIDEMEKLFFIMKQEYKSTPTFAFIDPFGYSYTPLHIIKSLMSLPMTEVLITVMAEEINRFLNGKNEKNNQHYDELFGCDDWRKIPTDPSKGRLQQIHDLYQHQLISTAGAKYVRSFKMRNKRNAVDYFLFFATKSLDGLGAMKRAMWKADSTGAYEFSDFTNPYQPFLLTGQNNDDLQQRLIGRFKNQTVTPEDILHYVLVETPYYNNFKKNVLKPLEDAHKISVTSSDLKRRRGTYPDDKTWITFL